MQEFKDASRSKVTGITLQPDAETCTPGRACSMDQRTRCYYGGRFKVSALPQDATVDSGCSRHTNASSLVFKQSKQWLCNVIACVEHRKMGQTRCVQVELKVPSDYPLTAPSATFRTRIFHPNIQCAATASRMTHHTNVARMCGNCGRVQLSGADTGAHSTVRYMWQSPHTQPRKMASHASVACFVAYIRRTWLQRCACVVQLQDRRSMSGHPEDAMDACVDPIVGCASNFKHAG